MNKIPLKLSCDNKLNFLEMKLIDIHNEISNDICKFLIHRDLENEYIDLDKYYPKYGKVRVNSIIENIIKELNDLGWKTKLSFGDTGLFIYSTEDPPSTCW